MLGYCFMFTWFPLLISGCWIGNLFSNQITTTFIWIRYESTPVLVGRRRKHIFWKVLWVHTFTLRRRRKRMKGEKEKLPNLAFSAKPNMTLTQIKPEVFLNKKETYTLSHSYLYFSQEYHYLICAVLCWIMTGPTYIYCGRWEIAFFSATTFYIMKYL